MVTYSASPTILQFKVNLTLTIFIALERCLALLFPIWYHKNCESGFAKVALSIGILFGAIDLTFFFGYGYNTNVPGCTATGCFISTISRQFTGISNMILGILVVLLTAGYLVKLQLFQGRQAQRRSFQQINRLASVILLSSLTLSTFPSLVIGAGEIITKIAEIFKVIGPFYVAGMTLTGVSNAIIFLTLNNEARKTVKAMLSSKSIFSTDKTVPSIVTPSDGNDFTSSTGEMKGVVKFPRTANSR